MDVLAKTYPTIPLSGDSELVRRYLQCAFSSCLLLNPAGIQYVCIHSQIGLSFEQIESGYLRKPLSPPNTCKGYTHIQDSQQILIIQ